MRFADRHDAGEKLADRLVGIQPNTLVVGIARGGVLVAKDIAKRLQLPLKILVVKKISSISNPELAIGAVGPEKTVYWDNDMVKQLGIPEKDQQFLLKRTEKLQQYRQKLLGGIDSHSRLEGKDIILVDDGIATGATAIAASEFLRKQHVGSILLAVPVIAHSTLSEIEYHFDRVMALYVPETFQSVGEFYLSFPQVDDSGIKKSLQKSYS